LLLRCVLHATLDAGHMLARLGLSSTHAIDACVAATALEFDTAVIATGDPDDSRRLAAPYRRSASSLYDRQRGSGRSSEHRGPALAPNGVPPKPKTRKSAEAASLCCVDFRQMSHRLGDEL
jgi:hypothetical protein